MTDSSGKLRVAVLFGGRSGEHEVSLASARSVVAALDPDRYEVLPVGITQEGRWLTGGDPFKRLTAAVDGVRLEASEQPGRQEIDEPGSTGEEGASPHPGVPAPLFLRSASPPLSRADVVFPVLHGPFGEDGTIQGLLEIADLPYVGAGVGASAVGMDKVLMKAIFAAAGLPQLPYAVLLRRDWEDPRRRERLLDSVERSLSQNGVEPVLYPLFVKPANLGSSVGVSKVMNRAELTAGLDLAARYDRKLVVEQALAGAREIELAVLGNDEPEVSIAGEVRPRSVHQFYDYEAKYTPGEADLIIPADLPPATLTQLQSLALRAFRAIDGAGLARADFLVDPRTLEVYVNELNTMPGFTQTSMYPKLWEASGLAYPHLIDRLIELALERHTDRARNQISRPS
ncbi:MAG TPA: D-alanine--D-alanine ligase A [Chloroflexi bacterium]|nr:D-alanine--D-alanine ligase A [Chloroflexota bacterium]